MKYIEETHKELRDKAAEAFWQARHYPHYNCPSARARAQYYAYAIAAKKLETAMLRERCAAKGVYL